MFEFCCGTPPSCLKVMGWVVGGLQHFSVSPRPFAFGFLGFGSKGLGPGLGGTFEKKQYFSPLKVRNT